MERKTCITVRAKKGLIASVNGWKINLQICYDLRFPVWIRQSKEFRNRQPARNMICWSLLQLARFQDSCLENIAAARAIENQCYVIGVNRTRDGWSRPDNTVGSPWLLGPLGETIKIMGTRFRSIFAYPGP